MRFGLCSVSQAPTQYPLGDAYRSECLIFNHMHLSLLLLLQYTQSRS